MIDDHNRCEWVNVSCGTAHLGCPGQNPDSHKMVVCVHVWLFTTPLKLQFYVRISWPGWIFLIVIIIHLLDSFALNFSMYKSSTDK